jgi:hypothetical protein
MLAKRFILALAIAVLAAVPAQAVILIQATDYAAAVGAQLWQVDFNEGTPETLGEANYSGLVDFGSPDDPVNSSQIKYILDSNDGSSIMSSNTTSAIGGIFETPVSAFSWESSQFAEVTVVLYDASGAVIESIQASSASGFYGVQSSQAVYSFLISNATVIGERPGAPMAAGPGERFFVDNFGANAATAIPEPGTIFLLGSGLVGLGAAYRRRKRS